MQFPAILLRMFYCQLLATLLLVYLVPTGLTQQKPVKYAPNYCLRFRFNCNRPEKKSHVCCLYPLPDKDKADQEEKRPTPNYGTAVKFRPVKLPKTNPKKTDNDSNNERGESNSGGRNKPSASLANLGKGRPNFNPSTATAATTSKPKSSQKKKSNIRPRICERLVINCKNSPEHRCCQYKPITPTVEEASPPPQEAAAVADNPTPSNDVKVNASPAVVKGEVEVVDLEIPIVVEAQKKYAKIINDEVGVGVPENEPYQRIPAECFTESFDCDQDPDYKCCDFLEK